MKKKLFGLLLWQKITLLLASILILFTILTSVMIKNYINKAGGWIGEESTKILSGQTEMFLEKIVRERVDNLDNSFEHIKNTVSYGSVLLREEYARHNNDRIFINNLLKSLYYQTNHAVMVYYFHESGTNFVFSPSTPEFRISDDFKQVMLIPQSDTIKDTHTFFWSKIHNNPLNLTNDSIVNAVMPIVFDDMIKGYIGVAISLNGIIFKLNRYHLMSGSYSFLLDTNYHLVGAPSHGSFELSSYTSGSNRTVLDTPNIALQNIFKRMIDGESAIEYVRIQNDFKYIAYHPLKNINWRLGLVVPTSMVTTAQDNLGNTIKMGIRHVSNWLIYWACIFFVLALILGIILSRQLTRSIHKMSLITMDIAAGDFSNKIKVKGHSEISNLGTALNLMSDKLQNMIIDLNSFNKELDHKNKELENEINERKITEEKLKELNNIINMSPVVVFLWKNEENWPVEYVSDNVINLFEYTAQEFISMKYSYTSIIHPEDVEKVKNEVLQYGRERGVVNFSHQPYRIITKSGKIKWIEDMTHIRRNEAGNITHFHGIIMDITERLKAEEELKRHREHLRELVVDRTIALNESEIRFQAIFEYAPVMIFSFNERGKCLLWNRECEKIFGWSKSEIIESDDPISLFISDPLEQKRISYKYLTDEQGSFKELTPITRDGKKRVQLWTNFKLPNEAVISLGYDITDMKQAEDQLKNARDEAESANMAKSEFLANMSHEIRTPLNAIIGFSELVSSVVVGAREKSYLNTIKKAGKTLLKLINDILDLSKIEAGKMKIQHGPANVRIIFKEIEDIFKLKVAEKKLELTVDIEQQVPSALILDEIRLRQILLNIVGNAVKFTEEGYIRIRVKKIDSIDSADMIYLLIAIEDTGIGIPEDQQELIFESFKQQYGQSTRKFGGTGLGLTISKRLIEMMNGCITVKSMVGSGSVFEITLKDVLIAPTTVPSTGEDFSSLSSISFNNERVLVVDDVESNRDLLVELLGETNLKVLTAENGEEAIHIALELKPAVIIMDIRMPVMDGVSAAEYLRKNPDTADIPLIALTASSKVGEKEKLLKRGFAAYLTKPVDIKCLVWELSKFIKHSKIVNKGENDQDMFFENIAVEKIQDLDELIQELTELLPLCKQMKTGGRMSSVKEFGNTLIALGTEHDFQELTGYGKRLYDFAVAYNIANIKRMLEEFPEMLDFLSEYKEFYDG